MNYSGNMPDWHQYNPQQSGINNITSTAQNVNSGHLSFISSISPTCPTQLNISSEGLEKHQNDPNFNPRHFQPHLSSNITHGHNATDNTPLASMVQMQNCIGHYGSTNTRNPMVDNLNGPMDPRNTAISNLNDELSYRNNQVPLNGPISHLNGPNMMNMNASHASMQRNTNVNSHTNRTGPPPSFVPCKGLCCNPDPNISYQQWEKYCSYQNNTAYRENIRSSAGYQTDTRRAFGSDFSFRKDNFDGKEVLPPIVPPPNAPNTDHRRNLTDFKYRKDRLMRNYPSSSSMLQNYPVQNYNYNAGDYQKYPYNIKDYSKVSGMNVPPSQTMVKHQEQGFAMPQQKYNSKQVAYQSNAGVMPGSMPSTNVPNPSMIPSAQNNYFNSQYPRNLPTDIAHDCQETADNVSMVNRMQASSVHAPSRYQMYQQKIAMQKFSMENDLRELSRIPGYQSHPKYKEYIQKYREILKLQQSVTYQGQMQQTSSCVAATSNATTTTVPSINLQFDQNGVLINSNYIPEAFSRMQQVMNTQAPMDVSMDKQGNKPDGNNVPEMASHNVQKQPEQLVSQQHVGHAITMCPDGVQKQDRYPAQKGLDQNQFEVQKPTGGSESFGNLDASASEAVVQHKMTKEFPDKPELDVRQFLANWDESEDEDGTSTALPHAVLTDSTPVVVVGYENVNLSTKTLEGLEVSKPEEIASGVITFESQDKTNAGVLPAQDCLTISYSTAENVEIAKDPACKNITKEGIVRTGGHIIQCISNGPDEVPTIHIVDNLEIGSILQVTNGQVGEALERQNAFFQEGTETETGPGAITLETDKLKTVNNNESANATEYNNDNDKTSNKEKYIVESPSPVEAAETTSQQTSQANVQKMVTLSGSMKDNSDPAQDMNLKKQSSFTSEESHNPDDISLPDLPTSECTPISTTLNTPIHSDNEESSERVQDLTISTNPIEIMQNSPIISFTQSSAKEGLYDHLSEEKTAKIKSSTGPLGDDDEYRGENRFKNDESSNNALDRDAVLDTFEFSTSNDKNNCAAKTGGAHYAREDVANTNEKTFSLDDEMKTNSEVADMRVTLTSGEYELQIVSASTITSALKNYKNTTTNNDKCVDESQIDVTHRDASLIRMNSQTISEASSKVSKFRYSDSIELENALQNITSNSNPAELDGNESEIIYSEKCIPTEMTRQTNPNAISLSSSTNNKTAGNSRTQGDSCSTKSYESDLLTTPTSRNAKHSTLNGDKIKQYDASASDKFSREEDSLSRKDVNKSANVENAKFDSKQFRHLKRDDCKKSKDQADVVFANKRCVSDKTENLGEKIRRNKLGQELESRKDVEIGVGGSDSSRDNKPKVIGNVRIDDAAERMRLLKEYRRIKSKPSGGGGGGDAQTKDPQEASGECAASKKCHHPSSSFNERSVVSRSSNDKHLCQKDTIMLKVSDEEERNRANVLRTLVTKNVNPDVAIQVRNVNLKLKGNKDNDQKESRYFGDKVKNNSSLDGIKIEINVSCTERNTTEKLLHENIKNAVAETIGHLTGSISNGSARSNSMCITEIPCDKKLIRDNADCRDYERHGIESSLASTEVEPVRNSVVEDQSCTEDEAKHKLATRKEGATTSDETSTSLISRKRRSLSSEQKSMSEDNGNINAKTESTPSCLEMSRSEQAAVRRKSVHQDPERKITNSCEELLIPSDSSTSKNVQKKEHQEMIPSFCRRNSQDDIASRLSAIPSTSSSAASMEVGACNNAAAHFDYDHFDVAPNESDAIDTNDKRVADRWKRSKRDDDRFDKFDQYKTPSGYVNPSFFSADKLENLNTVPVYTTKDGKITYSPNPRFTYRELLKEARAKEDRHTRESYFARSSLYHNCFKLRKLFKRSRDDRKRETDCSVDAKPSATKHTDYPIMPKITAHKSGHCKFRGTSHLEFFNDDADKLYTSKSSQQETKEVNRKNIIDLSFLEKQYNLDSETASSSKQHFKTKVFADNLECGKRYGDNLSVFDSNLFLSPRAGCWDETMESIKSYSSHIDRRNSDNLKELNFNEIFAQKRLDTFSFLSAERSNENHRTDLNEPTLHRDRSQPLVRDDNLQYEQSNIISHEEQNNENNKNDDSTVADVDAKSATDASSIPRENNERTEKRKESQSDEIQRSAILFAKEARRSRSPENIANENIDSERDRCLADINDKNEDRPMEDDARVCCTPKENNVEDAEQRASDENSIKVANPFEPNADPKDSFDAEEECKKTAEQSALGVREQDDEIGDDVAKDDNLEPAMSRETLCHEVTAASDCKSKEEDLSEPIVSNEIDRTELDKEIDSCDKEQTIVSQNLGNVANRSLDEESNEQQRSRTFENEKQITKISLNDRGNENQADNNCDSIISGKPVNIENVCDLFADEKREQNISEFTVVKSVIKSDKKHCQEELERDNNSKDRNDSPIDSKLLCMDSSDCGIFTEDRCANDLMREFNEDDSMVLMKWETSRIQEDAVNRLCGIDDTSIDFVGVTTSLQDNSLLDNLSISRTLQNTVKELRVSETIAELEEDKSINDEAVASALVEKPVAIEESSAIEESDKTPNDDEVRNQVSSSSGYDKLTYLRATDCNANTKMVPKLVIKKNEASSKFVTKISSSAQMDHKSISSPGHQPKIPKMIIRNASSRPGTPSIEAVRDDTQTNIQDRNSLANEEQYGNESESSLQDVGYRNKIPKMKIKLDEKHSSKIVRADESDEDICARRKNAKKTIPKMRIKNSSRTDLSSDGSVCKSSSQESSRRHEEKIPILKLRKQERNRSSSPELTRKRSSSSNSEVPSKKYKKAGGRDETGHSARRSNSSDSIRSAEASAEAKKNPLVCISEKIPKVIIKRTSASAEFRCELSKDCKKIIAKSAKWQPEVKLERYRSLDSMIKDLKLTLSPVSLRAVEKIFANRKDDHRREEEDDHRLSRSSSTSNLIPAKRNKQRRMSDYDYRKSSDGTLKPNPASSSWNANSNDKTYISPKKNASSKSCGKSTDECQNKNKPQRSRSRDDNSQTETDVTSFDNDGNRSFKLTSSVSQHDERKSRSEQVAKTDTTIPSDLGQKNVSAERPSDSASFKIASRETSGAESCFVKLPKEISSEGVDLRIDKKKKEQDNNSLSSKEKSKIVIKKERLSISDIDDNDDCTLQSDVCSLKDTPVTLEQEDNFETDNTVIKIESSDESQSTIEILPASPDDDRDDLEDHVIEDGDNEQLYSADAIPTQFELELEITDNSNIDLLDVPMPKLDPILCHGSRRQSTEEFVNDQTWKAGRYNKSESSLRNRNSVEREKYAATIDVNEDDKSTSHDNPTGSVRDVSSKAPCETSDLIATKENFCCNDSLVKEVLAAKEALKKCLSLSKCESGAKSTAARPKTAAEKKQGLSFDLNSLSDSKSSEVSRGSCSDVARSCISAASKPSRIETTSNVEKKSDKECSKQSKSSLVRKKLKPHEKSERPDSKEMTKRTCEYTTISLKAVKRFSQTASNENRAVNQNEKRKQDTEDQTLSVSQSQNISQKENNKLSSYKIPKISKSTHQESDVSANAKEIKTTKEDNMPILEPEVDVNFDASTDRDTSRSPPVITIHDSDDLDIAESKLIDDNVITSDNKVESDAKDPHNKKGDMSVADFITQLAYHEKATIRHRRYCNLCERWFPTTSRHRRHLDGYQHRHIELTQRRSIHALFMLFTGKPCPRLPPANVVRNDCSVGELTPLQIAVQDITKCYDRAQQSPKKENDK